MDEIAKLNEALELIKEVHSQSNYEDKSFAALVTSLELLEKILKYKTRLA